MPELLIKADDLRPGALSTSWRSFLEYCIQRSAHANVGVVGSWTANSDDEAVATPISGGETLRWVVAEPHLHLWNHGFTHRRDRIARRSEFLAATVEEQVETIRRTQDRIEELCGFRPNAWGAPFNWTDHNTIVALQEFPEIEYSFYTPYVPGKVCYHHELFVTCEPFAGEARSGAPRHFDLEQALNRSQHFRAIGRSFILQVHPNRWVDGALDNFGRFLDQVVSDGYTTGTVESFALQDTFARPEPTTTRIPSAESEPMTDTASQGSRSATLRGLGGWLLRRS